MSDEAFIAFMKRVDTAVSKVGGTGFDSQCYADAPWRDLFDDLGEEATDEAICECLAEYDDMFNALYELHKEGESDV